MAILDSEASKGIQALTKPDCENCSLNQRRVGSRGPIDAELLIVGESPGHNEVRKGIPFVGKSGELLWNTLDMTLHTNTFVTNAIQCTPKHLKKNQKDIPALKRAVKACQERLLSEIRTHPRKLIIALGNAAVWSLTGDYNSKITSMRGGLIPSELSELGILPIIHPAAILRGPAAFTTFKGDFDYAKDLINGIPPKKPTPIEYVEVVTHERIDDFIEEIACYDYVSADFETAGFNQFEDEILCLGVMGNLKIAYIIPEDLIMDPELQPKFNSMFVNTKTKWIWQNGKFDLTFAWANNMPDFRVDEDTLLLSYALNENPGVHDLEYIGKECCGTPNYKSMLDRYLPKKKSSYRVIPKDILYKYCALDLSTTLESWKIYRKHVRQDEDLEKLYTQTLIPNANYLPHLEMRGLYIDKERLEKLSTELQDEIAEREKILSTIAGTPINPNSPKQMSELLFDKLRFKSRHGRSTAIDVLEKLPNHPAVKALKEHRKIAKQYSTYVKGTPARIRPNTGTIHTTYKIHGTRTGRLSSEKPNFQNIPRDPRIRGLYIARPGFILVEADLNQAELRCLAQLSGDPDLIKLYNDPEHPGLHHEVSMKLFGEDYTKEDKMKAKGVNFGIIYGREAPSLAEEFGESKYETQRWIDGWYERFPIAGEFIRACRATARTGETITTCFGRKKRHALVIEDKIHDAENQAANFPHQSIAGDLTTEGGRRARPQILKFGAYLCNTIHDSNVMEIPDNNEIVAKCTKICIHEMQAVAVRMGMTKVPFLADAEKGYRWGSLEKYDGWKDNN